MIVFLIISFLVLINYCGIITFFIFYFNKKDKSESIGNKENDFVLLVVFKNEENNIINLLQSFTNLKYPLEKHRIILANDNSNDKSIELIEDYVLNNNIKNIEIINLNRIDSISPKYFAFKSLIGKLTTKYVVLLDADCEVKNGLLNTISNKINHYKPTLILNPLIIKDNKTIFSKFQAIEFSSLMASTIASCKMGKPIMANGASMVVKTDFLKKYIQEYESKKVLHGDDMYMLDLALNLKEKIIFNDDFEAISITSPKENIGSFIKQRTRWASKSALYRNSFINYVAASVLFTSFVLFSLLLLTFFNVLFLKYFVISYGLKFLFDGILIYKMLKFEQRRYLFLYSFWLGLIYPLYVTSIFVLSLINRRNIHWK